MYLKVLEFNMESNELLIEGGSTITFDECQDTKSCMAAYAESLAIKHPEIVVITPVLLVDGEKISVLKALDKYGIPTITVKDLGVDIKPLCKEDIKMDINNVVDGLESDVKEAIESMETGFGGAKKLEENLKKALAKGQDVITWVSTNLKVCALACNDFTNNKYMTIQNKITDKVEALVNKSKDKKQAIKKIGNYILVAILSVIKALLGVIKFAADIVVSVAKYVGCTVIDITKNIGTTAKDIVQAFKNDLIDIYRKPVTA